MHEIERFRRDSRRDVGTEYASGDAKRIARRLDERYAAWAIAGSAHPKAAHALQQLEREVTNKAVKKAVARVLKNVAATRGVSVNLRIWFSTAPKKKEAERPTV